MECTCNVHLLPFLNLMRLFVCYLLGLADLTVPPHLHHWPSIPSPTNEKTTEQQSWNSSRLTYKSSLSVCQRTILPEDKADTYKIFILHCAENSVIC